MYNIGYFIYPLHESFGGAEIRALEFEDKFNQFSKEHSLNIRIKRIMNKSDLEDVKAVILYGIHYKNYPFFQYLKSKTDKKIIVSSVFVKNSLTILYRLLSMIPKPKTTIRFSKEILDGADYIFTNSNYEKSLLLKAFNILPSKISVLPNMIDTEYINSIVNSGPLHFPNKIISNSLEDSFLCIGRIEPLKNQVYVMESFLQGKINQKIIFIGSKNYNYPKYINKFNQLLKKHNQQFEHIEFLEKKELYRYIANSRGVIFPSKFETMGRVALEASVIGVPVIAANLPALREYIQDYNNVFFFKNNSHRNLIRTVETVNRLLEKKEINRYGKQSNFSFSYEVGIAKYVEYFSNIIREG